ncbi:MAG: class I SAM-dependent methyltransferase [Thermoanaerobaculia bacterium]|nr:class I SAM-dependent methyltransferase [Thermoanaerobaculia bacterium]
MSSTGRRAPAVDPGSDTEPQEHRSLAFDHLLHWFERRGARQILDLGPALGCNVSFLSSLPSKLFIADLPQSLATPAAGGDFAALLERELPALDDRSLDAVLAWDLLNYLQPPQIEVLARRLARCCAPGALLFSIVILSPEMPDRPRRFEIGGRDTLRYRGPGRARRSSPRYTEPDLRRWLAGFDVDVTYLLRNGMQEYLFARTGRGAFGPE